GSRLAIRSRVAPTSVSALRLPLVISLTRCQAGSQANASVTLSIAALLFVVVLSENCPLSRAGVKWAECLWPETGEFRRTNALRHRTGTDFLPPLYSGTDAVTAGPFV